MTLVQAQQRYIDRVTTCHPGHINRVRRSARRQLHQWADSRGYQADVICRDAYDMTKLLLNSDD